MHQDSRSELPPAASPPPRARWRPDPARLGRLRWATGLWLFLFAATHLTNHALGLVSLRAMEAGRELFLSFWRLPPIEASLALALLVHVALGLHRLWQRRTLHLRAVEVLQLALGLSIPLYLTGHVLNNGWLHRCCGLIDSYAHLLGRIWPDGAWSQTTLTLLVWLHGAIGVQQRLRLEPFYHRLRPWLLVAATLLPVLAIGGMVSAGRELAVLRALDPVAWRELAEPQGWTLDAAFRERFVATPERWIVRGFLVLVAAVLLMRALRGLWERRRRVRLLYPGEDN